jgi:hypothetical protein
MRRKKLFKKGVLKGPCNEIVCFRVFMNQLFPWHMIKVKWCNFRFSGDRGKLIHEKSEVFNPYRSHFISKKSLIAAENETKEKR